MDLRKQAAPPLAGGVEAAALVVGLAAIEATLRALLLFVAGRIIAGLDAAGIGIASATDDIVAFPAIELRQPKPAAATPPAA